MKRIYDNINERTTVDNDEEECAIKAEYCKCWVGQKLPPPSQTWLSPRQNSKEKNNATVAEILTRNLELQRNMKLGNLPEMTNHHPERREWLEAKRNIEKVSTKDLSPTSEMLKIIMEPADNTDKGVITVQRQTAEENQASMINMEKNVINLSHKPIVEESEVKIAKLPPSKNQVEEAVAKKERKPTELETDPDVIRRRQKQIDYGKNTEGYRSYLQTVSKSKRSLGDPRTPPLKQKLSRRNWDAMIRSWRLQLHQWDPPALDTLDLDKAEGEAGISPQKQSRNLSSNQVKEDSKLDRAYKQLRQRVKAQRAMMSRLRIRVSQSSPGKAPEQLETAVQSTV